MGYKDITKECVDCQEDFVITAGEQQFYDEKGLALPKRCKDCRAAKKARNENGGNRNPNKDSNRDGNY
jgi:hypothetical protein